ncbi:MAG: NADPH:quinone oxidoreductase family protein [Novosphingobium sp.]
MKALLSHQAGGPETLVLSDVAEPTPGPGQVRIAVKACSINFPDTLIIRDLYQFKPQRPFAPGGEVAGVIDAVGEGVDDFAPGDRVLAMTLSGGIAEKVLAPATKTFVLPDAMDFETASAFVFTYGTTIHALKDRGRLASGDTLLVLGAAGGTGLSAVELGKAMGARVVAAVSSEEKAEVARQAGADAVVIYPQAPLSKDQSKALADAFKSACGGEGANVVYDAVGGDYSEPAVRATAWEGRFLVIGFPAGIARLPLNLALLKSCDICGVFWGAFTERDPQAFRDQVAELFALHADGKIGPRIGAVLPMERGGDAIALLADRKAVGKVVVRIGD